MAIDTAPKRRSAAAILTGLLIVGVTPSATPDATWRQAAGWGYVGIPAGEPVAAVAYVSSPDDAYAFRAQADDTYGYAPQTADALAFRGFGADTYILPEIR